MLYVFELKHHIYYFEKQTLIELLKVIGTQKVFLNVSVEPPQFCELNAILFHKNMMFKCIFVYQ